MKAEWQLFALAVAMLTRWVPAGPARAPGGQPFAALGSLRHFPGVGLLIGGLAAAGLWAAGHAWPALLSVLASVAVVMWVTRARHELGLVRCFAGQAQPGSPGLAGGDGPMAASPALGLIALLMLLSIKAAALYSLVVRDLGVALAAMVLAHSWSRAAMVLPVLLQQWRQSRTAALPRDASARPAAPAELDNMALPLPLPLPLALLWCVLAAASSTLVMPGAALVAAALACALTLAGALQQLRLQPGAGGSAGMDAVQQLCEVSVYLAVVAVMAQG